MSLFPYTKRYYFALPSLATGQTPAFSLFARTDTFAGVSPPTIHERAQGLYYFDWTFASSTDPDIVYQINGNYPGVIDDSVAVDGGISVSDIPGTPNVTFPYTKRYTLQYLLEQTSLSLAFQLFQKDSGATVAPPAITNRGNGWYSLDWTFATPADEDLVYLIAASPGDLATARSGKISIFDLAGSWNGVYGVAPQFVAAILAGQNLTLAVQEPVLNRPALVSAGNYSVVSQTSGDPSVTVASVAFVDSQHVLLTLTGTLVPGHTYNVNVSANTAQATSDGTPNAANTVTFTVPLPAPAPTGTAGTGFARDFLNNTSDPNNDLVILNGDLVLVRGTNAIVQDIHSVLQFFKGEWFLDTSQGIDWMGLAFVKNPDLNRLRAAIRSALLSVQGVTSIEALTINFDAQTRAASVAWTVLTDAGLLSGNTNVPQPKGSTLTGTV